jgi:hypothetical protein
MDTITELGKALGVPIRRVNVRDPNVFQREQETEKKPENLPFKEAVRFEYGGIKAEIRGNGSYLVSELKTNLDTGVWSINQPDRIVLTHKVQNSPIESSIFAATAMLSAQATEIIHHVAFQSLLKELDLGPRDSLHFYRNAVVYYARTADAAKFLKRTNALCRLVAGITSPQEKVSRHVDLPEPFADLTEYAQAWAISDDTERAEALENAPTEVLRKLIEHVAPRLSSINEYLDTHSGERAAALGSLAETVSEAQIAIQQAP